MTQYEFETRAGINVSAREYESIEAVYMASDLCKDDFCRQWARMNRERISKARQEEEERQKQAADRWNVGEICFRLRGASSAVYDSPLADHISKKEGRFLQSLGFDTARPVWAVIYKMMTFAGIA